MKNIKEIALVSLLTIIGLAILFIFINLFVQLFDFSFLNNNSGTLSCLLSLLLVFVTLLNVKLTWTQVSEIEKQSKLLQDEVKVSKQPCIIPEITSTMGTECFTELGRRQLHIHIKLQNFGDSPALSIFTIGYFELKYTTYNNSDIVKMYYIPEYITGIETNGSKNVAIRFERKEIHALLDDMIIGNKKNVERVRNNSSHKPYPNTNIVIKTFYKNTIGQWFESTIKRGIDFLVDVDDKEVNISIGSETVIPPQPLNDSTRYELRFISEHFSPSNVRTISDEDVEKILSEYDNEDVYKECQKLNME